jgi:hypothetical protein
MVPLLSHATHAVSYMPSTPRELFKKCSHFRPPSISFPCSAAESKKVWLELLRVLCEVP